MVEGYSATKGLVVAHNNSDKSKQGYFSSSTFLKSVLDTNPNLIFVKDENGRFTLGNKAVAEIYGTSVESLIGKTDADFNENTEEVDWYSRDDQHVIHQKETLYIPEEKVTSPDGEVRWFETVKKPIKTGEDVYQVLGVATEITERKKLYEQLLQAQKMEAIGKLAGGIAHDFNNLLTVILGYASVINDADVKDPMNKKAVHGIEQAAQKAAELTQKLLGFAREGKHLNICIDIHAIIKETVSILKRTLEENITIQTNLSADLYCIQGDPIQIQQVIFNLAINARDAMTQSIGGSDGGVLSIETCNRDDLLVIEVSDTGCGMTEDTSKQIFEPFFTTKDHACGTGLGLAMVYGILSNHQGDIACQSEIEKGSNFIVNLPTLPTNSTVQSVKTGSGKYSLSLEEYCILLVDDNTFLLNSSSLMLTSLGHDVYVADSAQSCLDLLREKVAEVDLIILDLVMPKMSAEDLIAEIFQASPTVKIILTTGYDANLQVHGFLEQGVAGYIRKPYRKADLAKKIEEVMS